MRHDTLFNWCKKCIFSFQTLKNALCTEPILKFPDPQRPCVLFTDASKYGGPSTSEGAAGDVVALVGSYSCFTGLMGWSESSRIVVQSRSGR